MWQLQEAKNKFSRLVEEALHDGPQLITRHGEMVVVLISYEEYRKMGAMQKHAHKTLTQFFRESPLVGSDLDLSRDQSDARADLDL